MEAEMISNYFVKPIVRASVTRGIAVGLTLWLGSFFAEASQADGARDVSPNTSRDNSGRSAPMREQNAPRPSTAQQGGPGTLKDAIELCERLAGTEREICLQRARENRERAGEAIGAT